MVGAVFALAGAHVGWLVLAILLHVCGQVSRGVAWRGVLAVSWPQVTRRRACAWYVCGAGLSGVLSARGGDAVRVTLAKRDLKGATWPALAGTLCAEGSFETVSGVALMLLALSLGVGNLHAPAPALIVALALAIPVVALLAARSARVRCVVREVGRGAAVLGTPGRWARQVLPYQAGARVLRLGAATCFLLAFGLPAAPAVVIAACIAQGSGAAVPLPGAGPATVGAALLVGVPLAAGHAVDEGAVASLAIVWPAALTAVGVTLSLVLLARLCGVRTPRALIRAARALRTHPAPATPLA
jgi:Lysylphosphatidylglycerol synthase TM region